MYLILSGGTCNSVCLFRRSKLWDVIFTPQTFGKKTTDANKQRVQVCAYAEVLADCYGLRFLYVCMNTFFYTFLMYSYNAENGSKKTQLSVSRLLDRCAQQWEPASKKFQFT